MLFHLFFELKGHARKYICHVVDRTEVLERIKDGLDDGEVAEIHVVKPHEA